MSRKTYQIIACLAVVVVIFSATICYAANSKPQVGTITPSSGTSSPNQTVSFTTTYTDADGWQNIQLVYFLVNTSTAGANCFYGYYNQNTNKLYLRDNTDKSWLGGYSPGSSYTIENSYAKLYCAQTTVSGLGTTLTVIWNATFKSTFTGAKNTHLDVKDDSNGSCNWTKKGTWTIKTANNPPSITSLIPANNSSFTAGDIVTIQVTATDPDGDSLQYQYYVDSNIKQAWTTASTYNWQTQVGDNNGHIIKVEVKDPYGATASKQNSIYIFRKPIAPPAR